MQVNKAFIFVVSNQFIHKISENIYDLAIPLIVLFYTQSPVLMGVAYALGFLADFLVGYFGGAVVDSFNRKKTLTIIAISQAILISLIIILHNYDILNTLILLSITFCIDLLLALYGIADISIIPEIVDKQDLSKANSYMQISMSIATSIGPSIAGAALTIIGLINSLWFTFLGFIVLIFSLSLIRYNNQIESLENSPGAIFKKSFEGIKYTWSNNLYRTLLNWNIFINLGLTGSVLMVIYRLKEELFLSSLQIGIVYTLSAIGGIVSGFILPFINRKFPSGLTLITSSTITSLSMFGLFLVENWIVVGILNAFLMGSVALNSRLMSILYQTKVPIDYLGRVNSASRLLSTILAPVSVLFAGYISKIYGANTVFLIGAIILFLTNLIAMNSQLRKENWGEVRNDTMEKVTI